MLYFFHSSSGFGTRGLLSHPTLKIKEKFYTPLKMYLLRCYIVVLGSVWVGITLLLAPAVESFTYLLRDLRLFRTTESEWPFSFVLRVGWYLKSWVHVYLLRDLRLFSTAESEWQFCFVLRVDWLLKSWIYLLRHVHLFRVTNINWEFKTRSVIHVLWSGMLKAIPGLRYWLRTKDYIVDYSYVALCTKWMWEGLLTYCRYMLPLKCRQNCSHPQGAKIGE
jgi:hypothetical protein